MYKIAVLGDAQSVQGFAALGLETCPAETPECARPILHRLAKEDTAIIYITEQLAAGQHCLSVITENIRNINEKGSV